MKQCIVVTGRVVMAVIVSKNGHEAHKVERSTFDKEDDLQRYLRDNPEALPVDQIREGSRILVLAREFATESGPIDLLAVDDQGSLYVIETKLYRNPDKRTVVAQVLDYGAALWKHASDFGQFRITLEEYMQKQWHATLEDQITATFGVDDEGRERILSNLADCLEDGHFRFLVLMDQVHDQLRDLVSYLNANSNFQLYCVELEYYRHDGYEILIPHVYGAEAKTPASAAQGTSRIWAMPEVVADAERTLGASGVRTVQTILEWAQINTLSVVTGTATYGSFSLRKQFGDKTVPFMQVAVGYKVLYVYFDRLKSLPWLQGTAEREHLLSALGKAAQTTPSGTIEGEPSIPLETLSDPRARDAFLEVLRQALVPLVSETGTPTEA